MNPTPENLTAAETAAIEQLTKELKTDQVEVTHRETAVDPQTGEQLVRVTGVAAGKPNVPRQAVVDSRGGVRDLAGLEAKAGRRLFVPDIGPARPPVAPITMRWRCCAG